ncbi:type I polyketide synthase [Asanoa ishikariensis]|uniref:PfaB family protein n=1 Tax=Asanoa ishikariensis TaxID=137265 RepID=A0A1H3UBH9_9ACTN|nr:beta-ketoacyl synthase N-terminal-like domain-containing protein [Asanoa ishikariensis]GIF63896.1 type I polyketide synthase [Asanoa ishikariensis]SDZ59830.1 PfaB family protein [Asanoa ishikariensis]
MSTFAPIAIVGRGCVLPGAHTPEQFWDNIASARVSIDTVRHAGLVRGFDPGDSAYDPALRWVLHAGRAALREAGDRARPERSGLVLGNLGYPSRSLVAYAESVWRADDPADPRDRFSSGLWAHQAANELNLKGGSLALDAACASALYAIKIACDRLHDDTADLMLAGAVSGCDGQIINSGFAALGALSPSGRSRPFHRGADGLVPAEGTALVALMRLRDAVDQRVPVLGVIRGIGLSNDGRTGGFLAPAEEGQLRAMHAAYAQAGFGPETLELLECHATGTPLGDAVEARSTARFFGERPDPLPIGSAKSNVGHLLTASGAAGLLKLLAAMDDGTFPATAGADDPIDDLRDGPLRLLTANEPWSGSRRRAAISAFGFGGNNAHLIVEAYDGAPKTFSAPKAPSGVAIVAISGRVGDDALEDAVLRGWTRRPTKNDIEVGLDGLRYPPRDLRETLGQQVLVLEVAREAVQGIDLPPERTAVLVGMGCDPETARVRGFGPPLTAARVLGAMANIAANRIGGQLGLSGPGFAVFAEEASGIVGLELAARALRAGEVDAALVGAVDLSDEPVHRAAIAELDPLAEPADAAVVVVLKRLDDARRDGDRVIAVLDRTDRPADSFPSGLFGAPHAARGLLDVAAAAIALHHRAWPVAGQRAQPRLGETTAEVVTSVLGAAPTRVRLRAADAAVWATEPVPRLHVYSGANRAEVLASRTESDTGPARLAVAARDSAHLAEQLLAARAWLDGTALRPPGVAFRERPIGGETAFVYTKGSAFYAGMGSDVALAFAPLAAGMDEHALVSWLYEGRDVPDDSLDQILAVGFVARLHTRITREVLGIEPQAAIGYSSGESAALVSLGVWNDVPAMSVDARASGLFTHDLGGDLRAVRRFWARHGITGQRWAGYLVSADAEQVRAMLADEAAVHLTAVCAPGTCVVAGEEEACAAFVARFDPASLIRIQYDLAAHAPELVEVRDRWHALHRRPTTSVPGIRFYRGATGQWYHPTEQTAADAITEQMLSTVDFPKVIQKAWDDGVRVFVEHGPSALCTGWIRRILGEREHVAVALDTGKDRGLWSLSAAVVELAAAGVPVRHDALATYLENARPVKARGQTISVPKRLAAPVEYTVMEPAPELAPMPTSHPAPRATSPAEAWRASITEAHHQFLDLQATAHNRFLAGRAAALRALAPAATRERPGPRFDRAQLEHLAKGRISDLLGPMFAGQDLDVRQTRMPGPPLLLADRVVGIDAAPGSLGKGTIWTETDVDTDAWYLDAAGRMPPGLVVEAGQADLLLISWLGADLHNRGERVYRLLGSDVTFHASPPGPGATLTFEIRVVGHVVHGPVRLFFFEYDCHVGDTLLLTVRDGQAGFFDDDELANTGGVIWEPSNPPSNKPQDPPAIPCTRTGFDKNAVSAFAQGRPAACFGPGWEPTLAHVRTPRIGDGRLRLLDEVPVFDPTGGPWGRGYLRAETAVSPDDWFFDGHFHNDPCMPGTLMSDGCLQAVSFYLAACGHTIARDGWRFEPVPGRTARMRCRGQVTPDSKQLTYEVFVSEVSAGPYPTVVADVLVTVDGVKALHVNDCAVRLVPDWPLEHWRQLGPPTVARTAEPVPLHRLGGLAGHRDAGPVAEVAGLSLGYASLLACAWGKPTDGLGPMAEAFLGARRGPRLPGPPYHFMSRIAAVDGPYQGMAVGSAVTAEYDVPDEVWYFAENAAPTMPAAVLMEVALQPCGWLGCYVGSPTQIDAELLFRNLDGDLRVLREVRPGTRRIRTRAELTDVSRAAGMIIESFRIECHADGEPLLRGTAVFGYFLTTAFAEQPGLPPSRAELERLTEPCENAPALSGQAGSMLMMLDRITGYWPEGGAAGLGRVRAEKDVDPDEWFFKAHFFQDPVMPGSLGVEAACQLLQWYVAERGIGADLPGARFEPVAVDEPLTWTYRGQVVPTDRLVTVELEILEIRDRTVFATAWLWIDGRRIYRIARLGARMVA